MRYLIIATLLALTLASCSTRETRRLDTKKRVTLTEIAQSRDVMDETGFIRTISIGRLAKYYNTGDSVVVASKLYRRGKNDNSLTMSLYGKLIDGVPDRIVNDFLIINYHKAVIL